MDWAVLSVCESRPRALEVSREDGLFTGDALGLVEKILGDTNYSGGEVSDGEALSPAEMSTIT